MMGEMSLQGNASLLRNKSSGVSSSTAQPKPREERPPKPTHSKTPPSGTIAPSATARHHRSHHHHKPPSTKLVASHPLHLATPSSSPSSATLSNDTASEPDTPKTSTSHYTPATSHITGASPAATSDASVRQPTAQLGENLLCAGYLSDRGMGQSHLGSLAGSETRASRDPLAAVMDNSKSRTEQEVQELASVLSTVRNSPRRLAVGLSSEQHELGAPPLDSGCRTAPKRQSRPADTTWPPNSSLWRLSRSVQSLGASTQSLMDKAKTFQPEEAFRLDGDKPQNVDNASNNTECRAAGQGQGTARETYASPEPTIAQTKPPQPPRADEDSFRTHHQSAPPYSHAGIGSCPNVVESGLTQSTNTLGRLSIERSEVFSLSDSDLLDPQNKTPDATTSLSDPAQPAIEPRSSPAGGRYGVDRSDGSADGSARGRISNSHVVQAIHSMPPDLDDVSLVSPMSSLSNVVPLSLQARMGHTHVRSEWGMQGDLLSVSPREVVGEAQSEAPAGPVWMDVEVGAAGEYQPGKGIAASPGHVLGRQSSEGSTGLKQLSQPDLIDLSTDALTPPPSLPRFDDALDSVVGRMRAEAANLAGSSPSSGHLLDSSPVKPATATPESASKQSQAQRNLTARSRDQGPGFGVGHVRIDTERAPYSVHTPLQSTQTPDPQNEIAVQTTTSLLRSVIATEDSSSARANFPSPCVGTPSNGASKTPFNMGSHNQHNSPCSHRNKRAKSKTKQASHRLFCGGKEHAKPFPAYHAVQAPNFYAQNQNLQAGPQHWYQGHHIPPAYYPPQHGQYPSPPTWGYSGFGMGVGVPQQHQYPTHGGILHMEQHAAHGATNGPHVAPQMQPGVPHVPPGGPHMHSGAAHVPPGAPHVPPNVLQFSSSVPQVPAGVPYSEQHLSPSLGHVDTHALQLDGYLTSSVAMREFEKHLLRKHGVPTIEEVAMQMRMGPYGRGQPQGREHVPEDKRGGKRARGQPFVPTKDGDAQPTRNSAEGGDHEQAKPQGSQESQDQTAKLDERQAAQQAAETNSAGQSDPLSPDQTNRQKPFRFSPEMHTSLSQVVDKVEVNPFTKGVANSRLATSFTYYWPSSPSNAHDRKASCGHKKQGRRVQDSTDTGGKATEQVERLIHIQQKEY